ncbi:phosphoglucomutase/phosphomannomutase family protein [Desulfolucanica intricata]|uniref:phosphoglucomutase/phosphomannomutase family protein n=1 Tax=Desulfolucanica intricata TaxID=1285191 RepID=UPI00083061F9|nr:phosphoglucomutase/phosphomannomutase family protein [Desulfolucanica intricata]
MSKIKFGTDGWRGIIARDFTFDNLRIVSQAVAGYINSRGMAGQGMVVGYDNRFLADQFAEEVAGVLAENGIPVYMTERSTPTPVTAYAIKEHNAAGAVMLTASHNPPEYNGFKFIPEYAGPALPHITGEIEKNIRRLEAPYRVDGAASSNIRIDMVNQEAALELAELPGKEQDLASLGIPEVFPEKKEPAEIKRINPFPAYKKHLSEIIDFENIRKAKLKVVVDPMCGCGIGYLDEILQEAGARVEVIRNYRDPLFGGSLPEPSAKLLGELKNKVLTTDARLGLALDGDADRFGIIDMNGEYITPNKFLPILFYHLLAVRGMRGPVARTVATTHLLDRMAEKYGLGVVETAVGFKYIGQCLLEMGAVLGGEESGGLSIKGHIPEKDGILAGLLAAEIVAHHGISLTELLGKITGEFGELFSERLDIKTTPDSKQRILSEMKVLEPAELAGQKVVDRITKDGLKLVLENGAWVLIRPSGTEPLFRVYVEANSVEEMRGIQEEIKKILQL